MQTRQLYSLIQASIAGTVYFDMPTSGRIKAVDWSITPVSSMADADYIIAEVSLSSAGLLQTNDAQGVISRIGAFFDLTTSGAAFSSIFRQTLCDYPVVRGQRIYLNATESGSGQWQTAAIVHFT